MREQMTFVSTDKRPIYVIDTNVLIDYPWIIPGATHKAPVKPNIDLSSAHLVIPTTVIMECDKFKGENSDRGVASRAFLASMRKLIERKVETMQDAYMLSAYIQVENSNQLISILPVHKDFKKSWPFEVSADDMDGRIILATLSAICLKRNLPINGSVSIPNIMEMSPKCKVTLLTNDNGLADRASAYGIPTSRYGYECPKPYTGRRDIIVPPEMFDEFYRYGELSRETWESYMPDASGLVANEFIVMGLANREDYPQDFDPANNPFFDNIGRYDAEEDKIVPLKYVRNFPTEVRNPGQAIYAEALSNPKFAAVICTGPAGSGKTYMATIYGYTACKNGDFIGVTAVPCESHSKLGALPGDLDEKMDPDVQPLKNALRNYLLNNDPEFRRYLEKLRKYGTANKSKNGDENSQEGSPIKAKLKDRVDLIWENWYSSVPIENARGRDFAHELAIYDEFQDQNMAQADTLIKRIGAEGKIIITGDIEQIHAKYLDAFNNGLVYASKQLFDNPMVAQVCFNEDEVVRHPLVKMIAKRQAASTDDDLEG